MAAELREKRKRRQRTSGSMAGEDAVKRCEGRPWQAKAADEMKRPWDEMKALTDNSGNARCSRGASVVRHCFGSLPRCTAQPTEAAIQKKRPKIAERLRTSERTEARARKDYRVAGDGIAGDGIAGDSAAGGRLMGDTVMGAQPRPGRPRKRQAEAAQPTGATAPTGTKHTGRATKLASGAAPAP